MTWKDFGKVLLGSYTAQVANWGREGIAAYVAELQQRGLTPDEAAAALRATTSDFPPSAGNLVAIAQRQRQGPVPDYMTAHRLIAQKIGLLDYFRPTKGFDSFIAALADEHEAVARFALAVGPRGVKEMPDPRYRQDTGGSTAVTRLERSYREKAKEWEEDPTPGLALQEARRIALGTGSPASVASMVQGLKPAAELEAGDPVEGDDDAG